MKKKILSLLMLTAIFGGTAVNASAQNFVKAYEFNKNYFTGATSGYSYHYINLTRSPTRSISRSYDWGGSWNYGRYHIENDFYSGNTWIG